jgi:TDG/mug DNA glycosylase family protein
MRSRSFPKFGVRPTCMEPSEGFLPIERSDARILVLGSLPGQKSLAAVEYYAHPQNAFWRIMQELFGIAGDYQERCECLRNARLALWDVLRASVRPGSLDADIQQDTASANDFGIFLKTHANIELIAFNGKKAEQLFRALVPTEHFQHVRLHSLPSTSPAYAAMPFSGKLELWAAGLELP